MALLQSICTVHEKTVMQANKKATLTNIQQRFTVEPMSAHKELQQNSERREKNKSFNLSIKVHFRKNGFVYCVDCWYSVLQK